ncbi:hypothetical protein RYX36_007526 [Vicia faba]
MVRDRVKKYLNVDLLLMVINGVVFENFKNFIGDEPDCTEWLTEEWLTGEGLLDEAEENFIGSAGSLGFWLVYTVVDDREDALLFDVDGLDDSVFFVAVHVEGIGFWGYTGRGEG